MNITDDTGRSGHAVLCVRDVFIANAGRGSASSREVMETFLHAIGMDGHTDDVVTTEDGNITFSRIRNASRGIEEENTHISRYAWMKQVLYPAVVELSESSVVNKICIDMDDQRNSSTLLMLSDKSLVTMNVNRETGKYFPCSTYNIRHDIPTL